jgi:hypothetical protein
LVNKGGAEVEHFMSRATCLEYAVIAYKNYVRCKIREGVLDISELRGKNLACWCPLVDKEGYKVPCHADILLELANKEVLCGTGN